MNLQEATVDGGQAGLRQRRRRCRCRASSRPMSRPGARWCSGCRPDDIYPTGHGIHSGEAAETSTRSTLPVTVTEPLGNETLVFAEFDGARLGVAHAQPQAAESRRNGRPQPRPVAGASVRCRDRQDTCGAEAMAKIERVELRMVDLVPKVKRTDAIQSFVSQETPIVTITDADGAVGTGYSYTIGTGGSSVMRLLADHLAPRLIGRDADRIEAIWHELEFATHATTDRRDHRDRARGDRHRAVGSARARSRACRCGSWPAAPRTAARSTRPRAAGCTSRRRRWSTTRSPPRPRAFAAPRSRSASRMAPRMWRGCRRCARRSATATRS